MPSLTSLFMTLAAALTLSGCGALESQSCTLIGCESGASFHGEITVPQGDTLLTITACRNGTCVSADVDLAGVSAGSGVDCGLTEPSCNIFLATSGSATIDLHFGADPFVSGETFGIHVGSGSDPDLLKVEAAVVYEDVYPNGPDCDPVPCRQATIGG